MTLFDILTTIGSAEAIRMIRRRACLTCSGSFLKGPWILNNDERSRQQCREAEERSREMTEANLAIARKVVLFVGLLVAALLYLYPHWKGTIQFPRVVDLDLGRGFIAAPPKPDPGQLFRLAGMESKKTDAQYSFQLVEAISVGYRIHRDRQLTEVALALLLTFGLLRALKLRKPAGD
jgi:hypothetical protein